MKRITFSLIFILFSLAFLTAQEKSSIQWKSMQEAIDMNPKEGKLIFVDAYTDWCGWCKRMDQTTFLDSAVISVLNEHFIPVKFNAEGSEVITHNGKSYENPNPGRTRSTHTFTYFLLGQRFGYPSFAFLDVNNNVIGVLPGYQKPEQLLNVLKYFHTDAYKTSTYDEWTKSQSVQE